MENNVRVGVSCLIFKDNKVLLGKRKNSHGADAFAGTGGHQEYGETLEETIIRETWEESRLTITDIQFLCVVDLLAFWPKHYLDVGFIAKWVAGDPIVTEPDKLESWNWYAVDDLPNPLFHSVAQYFDSMYTGREHHVVRP